VWRVVEAWVGATLLRTLLLSQLWLPLEGVGLFDVAFMQIVVALFFERKQFCTEPLCVGSVMSKMGVETSSRSGRAYLHVFCSPRLRNDFEG